MSGSGNLYIYILIMAGISYILRTLPMVIMRKPLKNKFLKSFLFYLPYVTLTVMTFPAIITVTGSYISGFAALIVGALLAYFTRNLFCCLRLLCVGVDTFAHTLSAVCTIAKNRHDFCTNIMKVITLGKGQNC